MIEGVFISVRFSHPTLDVADLCISLGLEPKRAWLAGQPRETPQGLRLEGTYSNSYCTVDLPTNHAKYLEDGLEEVVKALNPYTSTLRDFAKNEGNVSVFVSLENGVFQGAEIGPKLLEELAALQISLEIDKNF